MLSCVTCAGISRAFKIMDDDNSRTLDLKEFIKGLQSYGIYLDKQSVRQWMRRPVITRHPGLQGDL